MVLLLVVVVKKWGLGVAAGQGGRRGCLVLLLQGGQGVQEGLGRVVNGGAQARVTWTHQGAVGGGLDGLGGGSGGGRGDAHGREADFRRLLLLLFAVRGEVHALLQAVLPP